MVGPRRAVGDVVNTAGFVLVAVDYGEASARAISAGGLLAERFGSPLRLLHAEPVDVPAYFTLHEAEQLERERRALREVSTNYLAEFGRRHTSVPFSTAVDDRPPVDAILHGAGGASMIVMGTHGRRGPQRWWLGSVAERVLREVDVPLLVTHAQSVTAPLLQRVVVSEPDSSADDDVPAAAREIAARAAEGDVRHDRSLHFVAPADATLAVVGMPQPRTAAWLAQYGEPLVRRCSIPVLFVPAAPRPRS